MKKVFITGGSRGIGEACVRLFAARGYDTAFQYNKNKESAKAVERETGAVAYKCDFCDKNQISELIEKVGDCDILVTCAGGSETGLLTDMSDSAYRNLMSVNLDAVFYLCRGFLPEMVRKHSGAIVNVSSVWGVCGASCEAAYSACKAALIGLGKAMAKETGPSNVRVNVLCPGVIQTDMLREYSQEDLRALADDTPLSRLGTPEDVARAALFLSSENASFITGQALGVNGGFVI